METKKNKQGLGNSGLEGKKGKKPVPVPGRKGKAGFTTLIRKMTQGKTQPGAPFMKERKVLPFTQKRGGETKPTHIHFNRKNVIMSSKEQVTG